MFVFSCITSLTQRRKGYSFLKDYWQRSFPLSHISLCPLGLTRPNLCVFSFCFVTQKRQLLQLSETEKTRLLDRLRADSDAGTDQTFKWSSVGDAFSDHLVWAYAFLFHGFSFVLYSLSLFLVRSSSKEITNNAWLFVLAYNHRGTRVWDMAGSTVSAFDLEVRSNVDVVPHQGWPSPRMYSQASQYGPQYISQASTMQERRSS